MEVSDLDLRNKTDCAIKICYRLGQKALEMVTLTKEDYKYNCFGKVTIFRWHGDFKKIHLSAELALKTGRAENVVNDRNVNNM